MKLVLNIGPSGNAVGVPPRRTQVRVPGLVNPEKFFGVLGLARRSPREQFQPQAAPVVGTGPAP